MELTQLRYLRATAAQGLWRGNTPKIILPSQITFLQTIWGAIFLALFSVFLVYAVAWLFHINSQYVSDVAGILGATSFYVFIFLPFVIILFSAIRYRTKPDFSLLRGFSSGQRLTATASLMLIVTIAISCLVYPHFHTTQAALLLSHHHLHNAHGNIKTTKYMDVQIFLATWFTLTVLASVLLYFLSKNSEVSGKKFQTKKIKNLNNIPFGLWIGESTGTLARLSHGANLAAQQQVALFQEDLAKNVLVLGGIGSGKTTRAIHPLVLQLFDQQCGGLIFNIKGDFHQAVNTFAKTTQRIYHVIGSPASPFNLLAGLTPQIAASFLKSTFLLSGGNRQDSFWVDTATELCRNVLGLLHYLPEHYHLAGLYCYLFDAEWKKERQEEIENRLFNLDDREKRLLQTYQHYENTVFNAFDEKVKSGVKATIAQILSPFNHPDLIDAFCTENHNTVRFEEMLNGEIFLVDLPLAQWGLAGKVASILLKLRFFNLMQNRAHHPEWNQDRYVFFICDEFQEIVSANKEGLSDLNFWDKSRSSKTIGIISSQSVSSFYAALGDKDLTLALLQNFRQKICFGTEDQNTIDMINRLLGTVETIKVTSSQSHGNTYSWHHSSSHDSTATSLTTHEKPLLDGQFFRTLQKGQALALLSFNEMRFDDVLKMQSFFV